MIKLADVMIKLAEVFSKIEQQKIETYLKSK